MRKFDLKNLKSVFIVAELSANHNQDKNIAISTIKAAKKAGANAIKLQTFTADTITLKCRNKYFNIEHDTIWDGKNLHDLYNEAHTPWDWHHELFDVARKEGLICFSTPFDKTSVDFLEKLNSPIYKIASPEITDIPLIEYIATKQKPIILSSGISRKEDLELAVNTINAKGNYNVAILKCTSSYPTLLEDANLATISDLSKRFNVIPGLSDHTLGILAPIVAVSKGARIIEKHFILDKSIGGPDVDFSLDFKEFKKMVNAVRDTEKLIGKIDYNLNSKVKKVREIGSRSLFVVENIKKGDKLSENNIRSIRPGYGLHPRHLNEILGKEFTEDLEKGTPLKWNLFK